MSEKKPDDLRISSVPPFGLRMLPDLRAKIERAAAESGRSLNAEIVARLESSFGGNSVRRLSLSALHRLSEDIRAVMVALEHELDKERGYGDISHDEFERHAKEADEAFAREHGLKPVKIGARRRSAPRNDGDE